MDNISNPNVLFNGVKLVFTPPVKLGTLGDNIDGIETNKRV